MKPPTIISYYQLAPSDYGPGIGPQKSIQETLIQGLHSPAFRTKDDQVVLHQKESLGKFLKRKIVKTHLSETEQLVPLELFLSAQSPEFLSLEVNDPLVSQLVIEKVEKLATPKHLQICSKSAEVLLHTQPSSNIERVHMLAERPKEKLESHAAYLQKNNITAVSLTKEICTAGNVQLFKRFGISVQVRNLLQLREMAQAITAGAEKIWSSQMKYLQATMQAYRADQ